MDSDTVIEFENVSKKYCRNLKKSLRYGVADISRLLSGRRLDGVRLRDDEFWALKDVSFSLKRGEAMGVIGHNGAGKTTTLKLINGLVKPNMGRISIRGKIGALIALGTGFNPILTGRENIRIAGAVIGYSNQEIEDKFDEIVDFAEIGDFIDAPVQSYSSGMLARLGFSVAIHTQPDILLVDEVLAVGDLNFVLKCFKKIGEFRKNGGSMMLVTHNLYSVRTNCDRVMWIENGRLQEIGGVSEVCDHYELFVSSSDKTQRTEIQRDERLNVEDVRFTEELFEGEDFAFEFKVKAKVDIEQPIVSVGIFNTSGINIISNRSIHDGVNVSFEKGTNSIKLLYKNIPLRRGEYKINLVLADTFINNQMVVLANCFKFRVKPGPGESVASLVRVRPEWELERN